MKTQSSSKPRLKNDTLGVEALKRLYEAHSYMGIEQFRELCIEMVQSGGGKKPTKDAITRSIQDAYSKDFMLTKASNFALAGMGYGV